MTSQELAAMCVAMRAHDGQKRKDGDPYILHPARVVFRVKGWLATVGDVSLDTRNTVLQTAWCHDVLEDTPTTAEDLQEAGVSLLALRWIKTLTAPRAAPEEVRASRKFQVRVTLQPTDWQVRLVKLADRLDNLLDLDRHHFDFWEVYARESFDLANALSAAPLEKLAEQVRTAALDVLRRPPLEGS